MPSKSLADLPSTPSPTALSAQTAHPRQILTPLLSFTSALLLHSFAVRDKSSHVFSMFSAVLSKTTGVSLTWSLPTSATDPTNSAKPFKINTYKIAICKSFIINTYEKRGQGGRGRCALVSLYCALNEARKPCALYHSLQRAIPISCLSNRLRTLCAKHRGVPPSFPIWNRAHTPSDSFAP